MIRSSVRWLDRLVGFLLFVDVQRRNVVIDDGLAEQAQGIFKASVIFAGLRCVLEYVLLPLIGIAVKTASPLILAVDILAIVLIFLSLRRFWQIGYEYRWQYFFITLVVLGVLGLFSALDLRMFFNS